MIGRTLTIVRFYQTLPLTNLNLSAPLSPIFGTSPTSTSTFFGSTSPTVGANMSSLICQMNTRSSNRTEEVPLAILFR